MKSFEDWFKELCSNYVWFERVVLHHRSETFKKVCNDVYTIYSTDQNRPFPSIVEARVFVSNKLNKINPDKVKVDWSAKAHEQMKAEQKAKEEPWIPLTGEERQKKLAEFKALIDAAPIINGMPPISKKQAVEEGGWIPAKAAPYPITTPEEAYVRDRRFAWIKNSFEPRTAQRLPDSMEEHDFNLKYDFENYDAHVKKFSEWYKEHLIK